MFDSYLQIADSLVVDISENAEQLSDVSAQVENVNQLTIGRRGFPRDLHFTVVIENVSADTNVDPVKFVLQGSPDGTNYIDLATITLFNGPLYAKVFSVAVGLRDFRSEWQASDDMVLRVAVRYSDAGGTDNFTYSAWLTGPNPYPSTDVLT